MAHDRNRKQPIDGDEEANELLTMLYKKGHNLADYIVEQILGEQIGRDEREDLVQDGFLRLIRNVEKLKLLCLEEQLSYMCKAMQSVAFDQARKLSQKRIQGPPNERTFPGQAAGGLSPEEQYIKKERDSDVVRCLNRALLRLTVRDRALLTLKYRDQHSDREIGEQLGIKRVYVRVYMARARKRLAAFYLEETSRTDKNQNEKAACAGR